MIKKIVLAVLIGLLMVVLVMQEDPSVKRYCERNFLTAFSQAGICYVRGTLHHINFFYPRLELVDVIVNPTQGLDWHWRADRVSVSFSWLHFFCFGSLDMHVDIDGMRANTLFDNGRYAIMEHINAFLTAPAGYISMFIKEINFKHAAINVVDKNSTWQLMLRLHSYSKRIDTHFKSHIYLQDGTLHDGDNDIIYMLMPVSLFTVRLGKESLPRYREIPGRGIQDDLDCHGGALRPALSGTCAAVISRDGVIRWHRKSGRFSHHVKVGNNLSPNSYAFDYYDGLDVPTKPMKVPAFAWLAGNVDGEAEIMEHSLVFTR